MPFVRRPGIEGLVFVPEGCPSCEKKHDCPDCFYCQQCSETRCRACRGDVKRKGKKKKRPSCDR
ncbi:MAG: hypothetical protein V2A66_02010 [Pseudomonadota bacterium]